MNIITLLEQLATSTHHNISMGIVIKEQSVEVQKAFLTNDAMLLKNQLGCTLNLADRTEVVQI